MIYLVSASPRRRELLHQIGVRFETLLIRANPLRAVDVNETPFPGEDPGEYAKRIAEAKAVSGWGRLADRRLPLRPVLAADTAVFIDGRILGKPGNLAEAIEMLGMLSGREHEVLTAVCCAYMDNLETLLSRSKVRFCTLSESEIREYASSGEPMDKAGGYAIQGKAARFIERMEGSYSGVMGLPLYETGQLLSRIGKK